MAPHCLQGAHHPALPSPPHTGLPSFGFHLLSPGQALLSVLDGVNVAQLSGPGLTSPPERGLPRPPNLTQAPSPWRLRLSLSP